nr:hypothetical protein [Limosilactobacillus ingluviei]
MHYDSVGEVVNDIDDFQGMRLALGNDVGVTVFDSGPSLKAAGDAT